MLMDFEGGNRSVGSWNTSMSLNEPQTCSFQTPSSFLTGEGVGEQGGSCLTSISVEGLVLVDGL